MTEFVTPTKKNRIRDVRRCSICNHGFWKGSNCPYHPPERNTLKIVEHVEIDLFYPKKKFRGVSIATRKKRKEKKKKAKEAMIRKIAKSKEKNCSVCGEPSGRRMCCSEICQIRQGSSWYGEDRFEYISVEEAQKRLEIKLEKKRLRDLKNDSEKQKRN